MIKIDSSDRSHLTTCSRCPSWREIRTTKPGAWREGERHLRDVHGELLADHDSLLRAARRNRSR